MSGNAPTPRLRCRSTESGFGRLLCAQAILITGLIIATPTPLEGSYRVDDAIIDTSEETLGLRVTWGGPVPKNYRGHLSVEGGQIEQLEPLGLLPASGLQLVRDGDHTVRVLPAGAAQFGGVDLSVRGDDSTRLVLHLTAASAADAVEVDEPSVPTSWTLAQLRGGSTRHRLDDLGSQLVIERHPGDRLRMAISPSGSVFDPRESISVQLSGHRTGLASGRGNLEMELIELLQQRRVERRSWSVQIDPSGSFPPVPMLITAPEHPGVYHVNWRLSSPRGVTQLISGPESIHRSWQWVVAHRAVGRLRTAAPLIRMTWESPRTLFPEAPSGLAPLTRDWLPWPTPRLPDWNSLGGRWPTVYAGPWRGDAVPHVQGNWVIPPGQSDQRYLGSFELGQLQRLLIEVDSQASGEWNLMLLHAESETTPESPLILQRLQLPALACYSQQQTYTHQLSWYSEGGVYRAVLSNVSESQPLTIHQLRLEQAHHPLPTDTDLRSGNLERPRADSQTTRQTASLAVATEAWEPPQRLISLFVNTPLLARTFGAQETPDPLHQQPLEDWSTFWTASQRLVQHARRGGYNCLTLTVAADGGTLYPTKALPNTGRFDSGRFFTDGRDAVGKDVVELILRLAGMSGLRVILAIDLNVPLEFPPSAASEPLGGRNPLEPALQRRLEQVIDELVDRYAEHPAWAGVALVMRPQTQLLFGTAESGLETELLAQFASDQQLTEQLASIAMRPGELAKWFEPADRRQAWLRWRAQRLADQHHRLAQRLRRQRPDLVVQLLLVNRTTDAGTATTWLERGLDQQAYQKSDCIFCLSYRHNHAQWPDRSEGESWLMLAGEARPWLGRKEGSRSHQPESLETSDAWQNIHASPQTSKSGIGEAVRRGWLQVMNQQLPIHWLDNLNLPPGGDPELTADIRYLLSRLPAIDMKNVPTNANSAAAGGANSGDRKRPLTSVGIHTGSDAKSSYLLLINTAPWPERVSLQLHASASKPVSVHWLPPALPAPASTAPPAEKTNPPWQSWVRSASYRLTRETLDTPPHQPLPLLNPLPEQIRGEETWELTLPAFGIRLAHFDTPQLRVAGWRSESEPEQRLRVRQQQDEFQRSIQQLAGQPRRFTTPPNADFTRWTRDGHPLDWTPALAPQAEIRPGVGFDNRPATAVHLIHRGGAGTCWLQSGTLPPTTTGRLAVAVRMAPAATNQPLPPVQLSLEVRDATGQRYWLRQTYSGEPAAAGNSRRDRDSKDLESRWHEPMFRFQLPATKQPIVTLRLGIDLQAEGELLIDRVQLFDRFLSPEERRSWQNQLFLTNRDLEEGILESTLRLQESWAAQPLSQQRLSSTVIDSTAKSPAFPPKP
jgi:hypothetical protein